MKTIIACVGVIFVLFGSLILFNGQDVAGAVLAAGGLVSLAIV